MKKLLFFRNALPSGRTQPVQGIYVNALSSECLGAFRPPFNLFVSACYSIFSFALSTV